MRKFMTTLLALVMLLSVAMPAFAAAATSPAELTEDESYVNIPIIYNIEYSAGEFTQQVKEKIDSENPSYRVVVSWTTNDGTVTIPGTYAWDAQNAKYIEVKGDAADAQVTGEASATVKIQNYSNAEIGYEVRPKPYGYMDSSAPDPEPVFYAKVTNYTWFNNANQPVVANGMNGFIQGEHLPSASENVAVAGQPVAESDIPAAHGSFDFKATNLEYWQLNGATEEIGNIQVLLYIPR